LGIGSIARRLGDPSLVFGAGHLLKRRCIRLIWMLHLSGNDLALQVRLVMVDSTQSAVEERTTTWRRYSFRMLSDQL
jgi:hypothetical protein